MGNMIKVGMADLKVCKCPDALTTLGLGSCVGVALYDPVTKVSGLLHCMLPDSTQIRNNSNVAKFADTGIDELIRQMENLGASKSRLVAKMAGGHFPDDHSRTWCTSCYERAACDEISDQFGCFCSDAWNPPLCRTVL